MYSEEELLYMRKALKYAKRALKLKQMRKNESKSDPSNPES